MASPPYFRAVAYAQLPVALVLIYGLGFLCQCLVVHTDVLDMPTKLGANDYYAVRQCAAGQAGEAGFSRATRPNGTAVVQGLNFSSASGLVLSDTGLPLLPHIGRLDGTMFVTVSTLFACLMASMHSYVAAQCNHSEYEEDWQKALKDSSLTFFGEALLWAFVVAHGAAHAIAANSQYSPPEALWWRATARVTSLCIVCLVPVGQREAPVLGGAVLLHLCESLLSVQAACDPLRIAWCALQRLVDVAMLVCVKWQEAPPLFLIWATRVAYCAVASTLLLLTLLTVPQ